MKEKVAPKTTKKVAWQKKVAAKKTSGRLEMIETKKKVPAKTKKIAKKD